MIDKWLKAGVLDRGTLTKSVAGTPQGGVISPLLANIFLHHVLEDWFVRVAHSIEPPGDRHTLIFPRRS